MKVKTPMAMTLAMVMVMAMDMAVVTAITLAMDMVMGLAMAMAMAMAMGMELVVGMVVAMDMAVDIKMTDYNKIEAAFYEWLKSLDYELPPFAIPVVEDSFTAGHHSRDKEVAELREALLYLTNQITDVEASYSSLSTTMLANHYRSKFNLDNKAGEE